LSFPAAKYDDQADALALVGQLIDHMHVGYAGKAPIIKPPKDGYRSEVKIKTIDAMTL
jgi:hypothetical protein